ncbi:MAG: hypothetical protein AAGF72_00945 [Pseudomonadota bacterium]
MYLTLVIVPFLTSFYFQDLQFIALPIIMVFTVVCVLPLFFIMRQSQALEWWHVAPAGVLLSLPAAYIYLKLMHTGPDDMHGPAVYLTILGLSVAASIAFWWGGVFRNPALPFVSRRWPYEMLLVAPLSFALWQYQKALIPDRTMGCIVSKETAQRPTASRYNRVGVQLATGEIVFVSTTQGYANEGAVDECAFVPRRKTLTLQGFHYATYNTWSQGCDLECPVSDEAGYESG